MITTLQKLDNYVTPERAKALKTAIFMIAGAYAIGLLGAHLLGWTAITFNLVGR